MIDLLRITLVGTALASLAFWVTTLVVVFIGTRRLRDLADLAYPEPADWPKVSVIVPACNEIDTLGDSIRAHANTSYPNVEIIVVDDRSSDGTSELVDTLAEQDRRIRALHVDQLPAGWLGKVHALQVGLCNAKGQWVLCTDADVHIAADTLEKAVAFCVADGRDLLTVIPRFTPVGPFVDAASTTMARTIFFGGQVWRAEDTGARQIAGFGAFILVRRDTFERSAGFEWLRMEIADDLGVGLVVKEAGGRLAVVAARDHVALRFYDSLAQMRDSIEKGGYGIVGRYSIARLVVVCAASLALELGVFAAFVPVGAPWLPPLGATGLAVALVASVGTARWLGRPLLSGFLFPAGIVLNAFFNLRSGTLGWWNGGIRWRGTFYPVGDLRLGQRVRWP